MCKTIFGAANKRLLNFNSESFKQSFRTLNWINFVPIVVGQRAKTPAQEIWLAAIMKPMNKGQTLNVNRHPIKIKYETHGLTPPNNTPLPFCNSAHVSTAAW